jgi:hypothetical protein
LITPFHTSISASYFAIASFEGRLAMNTTAMDFMPNVTDALKSAWPTLANKIGRRWTKRSVVAHSGITGHFERQSGRQIWLQPGSLGKDGRPIRYFKHELDSFVTSFRALAKEIDLFNNRCFRAMTQQESDAQAQHPLHASHAQGGQNPTKPQGRQKPSGPKQSRAGRRARAIAAMKRKTEAK